MSFSLSTGPYFGRPATPDFKMIGLKGQAAAEVNGRVCFHLLHTRSSRRSSNASIPVFD